VGSLLRFVRFVRFAHFTTQAAQNHRRQPVLVIPPHPQQSSPNHQVAQDHQAALGWHSQLGGKPYRRGNAGEETLKPVLGIPTGKLDFDRAHLSNLFSRELAIFRAMSNP